MGGLDSSPNSKTAARTLDPHVPEAVFILRLATDGQLLFDKERRQILVFNVVNL